VIKQCRNANESDRRAAPNFFSAAPRTRVVNRARSTLLERRLTCAGPSGFCAASPYVERAQAQAPRIGAPPTRSAQDRLRSLRPLPDRSGAHPVRRRLHGHAPRPDGPGARDGCPGVSHRVCPGRPRRSPRDFSDRFKSGGANFFLLTAHFSLMRGRRCSPNPLSEDFETLPVPNADRAREGARCPWCEGEPLVALGFGVTVAATSECR
jgi:hypothetical protein